MRILILALLMAGGFAQASGPRTHLKCYLATLDGKSTIVHYEFEGKAIDMAKDPQAFADSLAGRYTFKADGTTKITIKKALECVPEAQQFKNKKAKKLDNNLPQ